MSAEGGVPRVLITGAAGFVGGAVLRALAGSEGVEAIVATDIREVTTARLDGVDYAVLDICEDDLAGTLRQHRIDTVVHLAAIVTPTPTTTREMQHHVDVDGTQAVVDACVSAGVKRLIYTSSGAAYGYSPAASPLLREDDPLRGAKTFAYSWHKRLVEDLLSRARTEHPELEQLIFRVGTVLGPNVNNQITAMFERPVVLGLKGCDTPFCFIADEDVAGCIVAGVLGGPAGVYNLAGDGVVTLREVAAAMGRRYVALPEPVVKGALRVLHKLELTGYGPEQTLFLKHRPVLGNQRLKDEFGYTPSRTSRQVFDEYRQARAHG